MRKENKKTKFSNFRTKSTRKNFDFLILEYNTKSYL